MIAYHQGLDLAVFSQSSGGENSWMESEAVLFHCLDLGRSRWFQKGIYPFLAGVLD
jgi:hypothetical protein